MFRRSGRYRFRGQGLVEFALVGPIFFFLVLGIIEGGRLVWTYHTLNNAVKEGTRYALVRGDNSELSDAPATDASVKTYMLDKSAGLVEANLSVDLVAPSMDNQDPLRVEATYQYNFIVSYIFGMGSTELEASSEAIFSK
jgi:Flp pilus assembly protein TadG